MSFRPSENEERYFAQLEIERRRVAEERRANAARSTGQGASDGTGRGAAGADTTGDGERSRG